MLFRIYSLFIYSALIASLAECSTNASHTLSIDMSCIKSSSPPERNPVITTSQEKLCINIYDPLTWGKMSPNEVSSLLTEECFLFYLKNRTSIPNQDSQDSQEEEEEGSQEEEEEEDSQEDTEQCFFDIVKYIWDNIDISWLSKHTMPIEIFSISPISPPQIPCEKKHIYKCLSGRERSSLSKNQWKFITESTLLLATNIYPLEERIRRYPNFYFHNIIHSVFIDSEFIYNFLQSFTARIIEIEFIKSLDKFSLKTPIGTVIKDKVDLIYLLPPTTPEHVMIFLLNSFPKTGSIFRKSNILPLLEVNNGSLFFKDFFLISKNPKYILLLENDSFFDFIYGEHCVDSDFLDAKMYCPNASKFTYEMMQYILEYAQRHSKMLSYLQKVLPLIPNQALGAISGEFVGKEKIDITVLPLSKISYLHSTAFASISTEDLESWPSILPIINSACDGVMSMSQIFHLSSLVKDPKNRIRVHHKKFNSIAFHHFRYHNSRNNYLFASTHFTLPPNDEHISMVTGSGLGSLVLDCVDFDWRFVQETPNVPARFVYNAAEVLLIPEFFRNVDLYRLMYEIDQSEQQYLTSLPYGISFNLPFIRAMCICQKNIDHIYTSKDNDVRVSPSFDIFCSFQGTQFQRNTNPKFNKEFMFNLFENDGIFSFISHPSQEISSIIDSQVGDRYSRYDLMKDKFFVFTDEHLESIARCDGKIYDGDGTLQFPWISVKHHVMYDLIFSASPLQVEGWDGAEFSKIPIQIIHKLSPESLLCFPVENLPFIADNILCELSLKQLNFIGAGGNMCWVDAGVREKEIIFDAKCIERGTCNDLFIINREIFLLRSILKRLRSYSQTFKETFKFFRIFSFYIKFKTDVLNRRIKALEMTVLMMDERNKMVYCNENEADPNFITFEYSYGNSFWIDFVDFLFGFIIVLQLLSFISWISGPSSMELFNNFPFLLKSRKRSDKKDGNKKKGKKKKKKKKVFVEE